VGGNNGSKDESCEIGSGDESCKDARLSKASKEGMADEAAASWCTQGVGDAGNNETLISALNI
jgi:hypothetical protein